VVTPGSHNLALRSDAERLAVAVDRQAHLLIYRRKREFVGKVEAGKRFYKTMVEAQPEPMRSALAARLKCLLGGGK
jgi:hypothetical protein